MGVDPSSKDSAQFNPEHLLGPIRNAYIAALWRARNELGLSVGLRRDAPEIDDSIISSRMLNSIDLLQVYDGWVNEAMEEEFVGWLQHAKAGFEFQKFSRSEVVKWLAANNVTSEYQFDKNGGDLSDANALNILASESQFTVDPIDFPAELDIGRIAFQAVQNGYGDQTATFRNRLVDFLNAHYSELTDEAVNRIATVANPDKTTGRKKRDKK